MAVMAEKQRAKKSTKASGRSTSASSKGSKVFTAEERAAIRERAKEMKASASKADGESAVLAKIAEMQPADRAIAERLHAIIMANAPGLSPRLWYGMPAYSKDGDTICFYQDAAKFKARYGTLGFNSKANLDEGNVWPVAYAVQRLTPADEARIGAIVKRAAG